MAAEIVNLNKFRKNHNRDLKKLQAKINRAKFGQTKLEKAHKEYKSDRENKEFMDKKLGDEDPA